MINISKIGILFFFAVVASCGVENSLNLETSRGILVTQGKYYILDLEDGVAFGEVEDVPTQLANWKNEGIESILISVCGSKNTDEVNELVNLTKTAGFPNYNLEQTDCTIATEEA